MTTDPPSSDRHFRTDYLRSDLKRRAVRASKVTVIAQGVRVLLQLGSTAILSRTLTPHDFGLVAIIVSIIGIVTLLKDGGLGYPTIQGRSLGQQEVSALFWINVALSVGLLVVVALVAPWLASFLSEPALCGITIGIGSTMIFGALSTQHQALLSRQLRVVELACIDVGSFVVAIAVAVAMAQRGYGHWSLVAMMLAQSGTSCMLLWWRVEWRPSNPALTDETKVMLRFGAHMAGFNIFSYAARNADNLLIGWYWGAALLGLYNQAYRLALTPIRQINDPLTRVVVPTLSRLASEPAAYRRYFLLAVSAIAYVTMPLAALLVVFSEQIIRLLLGRQWLDAIPMFQALAIGALLQPTLNAMGWLYITSGRPDRLLRLGVATSITLIAGFAVALPAGPHAVAWSFSLVVGVLLIPAIKHACIGTSVSSGDVLRTLLAPALLSATFAIAAFFGLRWGGDRFENDLVGMTCALALGSAPTVAAALLWPRSRGELTRLVSSWGAG